RGEGGLERGSTEPTSVRVLARLLLPARTIQGRRTKGEDMKNSRRLPILFILLGFVAVPSLAQVDTGAILGTVRDPSGGVLPGATVTLTHVQTRIVTRATTESRGNYETVGL